MRVESHQPRPGSSPSPAMSAASFGDLFGALVGRKISLDSELYQSASIELSLPELSEQRDVFLEDQRSEGCRLEFEPPTAADSNQDESKEGGQDARALPEAELGSLTRGRMARPYLSMATESVFTASLHRLRADSPLVWEEAEVVRLVSLAMRGVGSSLFEYESPCPPPILVRGYSIGAVNNLLREVYWVFLRRTLLAYALSALATSSDPAQSALTSAVRELLFLYDTSLMPSPTTAQGTKTLLEIFAGSRLHRVLLSAVFRVVASPQLVTGVGTKTFVPDRGFLRESFWRESGLIGWDLLASLFEAVEKLRFMTHAAYKPSVFPGSRSEESLDESFVSMVVPAFVLQRVASVLLEEIRAQVFTLNTRDEASDTLMSSVDDIWSGHGDNVIGQLRAMGKWARGRVHLLKGGVENVEIVDFCRDNDVSLQIPLRYEDLTNISHLVERCRNRYEILHSEVVHLLQLWNEDTLVFGDSLKRNRSYEKDFRRIDLTRKVFLAPPKSDVFSSTATAEGRNQNYQSDADEDKFVVSSGSIIFRSVDRGLVEEAKNEILLKHGEKMREVEKRSFLIEWRIQRIRSLESRRKQLYDLFSKEKAMWLSIMSSDMSAPISTLLHGKSHENARLSLITHPNFNTEMIPENKDIHPMDAEGCPEMKVRLNYPEGPDTTPLRGPSVIPGLGSSVRLDHPEGLDTTPAGGPGKKFICK